MSIVLETIDIIDESYISSKKIIGYGSYGKVYEKDINTVIKIPTDISPKLTVELDILHNMRHPILMNGRASYNNNVKDLIYEFPKLLHGNLFTISEYFYEEDNMKVIMFSLLSAMNFLHSNYYLHLDISPKNMGISKNYELILYDFGACSFMANKKNIITIDKTRLTTFIYGSPDYLNSIINDEQIEYNVSSDIWSFFMTVLDCMKIINIKDLCSRVSGKNDVEICKIILEYMNELNIEKAILNKNIGQSFKDLLIFIFNNYKSISVFNIMNHTFFENCDPIYGGIIPEPLTKNHEKIGLNQSIIEEFFKYYNNKVVDKWKNDFLDSLVYDFFRQSLDEEILKEYSHQFLFQTQIYICLNYINCIACNTLFEILTFVFNTKKSIIMSLIYRLFKNSGACIYRRKLLPPNYIKTYCIKTNLDVYMENYDNYRINYMENIE